MSTPRLDPNDAESVAAFIRGNTLSMSPPLVPEISLHLAVESMPIWEKTEEELGEMNLPPPFWAFAWAGGQAVSRYILDNPGICRDKSVLDLGSGSGMSAIAAAKCGARDVTAADIDRLALAACRMNAESNGVALSCCDNDILDRPPPAVDVVIVGDLFYERLLAERVMSFCRLAKSAGAIVLIGDPSRSYFPPNAFTKLAEYQVKVTRELEDSEIKRTAVWQA